mmetsp:Transcript_9027/g.34062  ORF Transcript_9027/g.34062 Transcript_9027/m.34062 type:complete len:1061 (-) Transcript_9027:22-3204(-)
MSSDKARLELHDPCDPLDYTILSGDGLVTEARDALARSRRPVNTSRDEQEIRVPRATKAVMALKRPPNDEDGVHASACVRDHDDPADAAEAAGISLRDGIDDEMDEMTDVLSEDANIQCGSGAVDGDHVESAAWHLPCIDVRDSIQGEKVQLSTPTPRSGHTLVFMRNPRNLLVAFGGLSLAGGAAPPGKAFVPYETALLHSEKVGAVYHNEVFFYHTVRRTWWKVASQSGPQIPCGRYGHCAVALDAEHMWTFGGRVAHGRISNEVHLFNVLTHKWTYKSGKAGSGMGLSTAPDNEGKGDDFLTGQPTLRYDASAVGVGNGRILMFGGRDLCHLYSDLWSWDAATGTWSAVSTVGTKPLPRFGHSMVSASEGSEILVLGGCCVSPACEKGTNPEIHELERMIGLAAQALSRCYEVETIEAEASGARLLRVANDLDDRQLARAEAQISARVAAKEKSTQVAAERLMALRKRRELAVARLKVDARHPYKALDVHVLDVQNMAWSLPDLPRLRGEAPAARHHFVSSLVGSSRVVVWGGSPCAPPSSGTWSSSIYCLNLRSRRWSTLPVLDSTDEAAVLVRLAASELRRARRLLASAEDLARSRAVMKADCIEVLEARARIKVCEWRAREVEIRFKGSISEPRVRLSAAHAALGHRVAILGGVLQTESGQGSGAATDELLLLSLEPPDEYRRRLKDEFHARLEMERSRREVAELQNRRLEEYKKQKLAEAQRKREAQERIQMAVEDRLSSFPPKTKPSPVWVRASNPNTVWFEWAAQKVDAWGRPIDRGEVTYILSLMGGYTQLTVGDPCRVLYVERPDKDGGSEQSSSSVRSLAGWISSYADECEAATQLATTLSIVEGSSREHGVGLGCDVSKPSDESVAGTANSDDEGVGLAWPSHSVEARGSPARVTGVHTDGRVDVRYSDGGKERKVPRWRVFPRLMPRPRVVYVGHETSYAATGLVPDNVVNGDPGFIVYVRALIQTLGTEHPVEEPSLFSDVVLTKTRWSNLEWQDAFSDDQSSSAVPSDGLDGPSVASSLDTHARSKLSKAALVVESQAQGPNVI